MKQGVEGSPITDSALKLDLISLYEIPLFSSYYWLCDYSGISEKSCRDSIDDYFFQDRAWWHPILFDAYGDTLFVLYPVDILDYAWIRGYNKLTNVSDSGWIFSTYPIQSKLTHWIANKSELQCLINSGLRTKSEIYSGNYRLFMQISRQKDRASKLLYDDIKMEILFCDSSGAFISSTKVPFDLWHDDYSRLCIIETDSFITIDHEFFDKTVIEKATGNVLKAGYKSTYFAGVSAGCFYFISPKGEIFSYNSKSGNTDKYLIDIEGIDDKSSFCINTKERVLYIAILSAKTDCLRVYAYKL